MHFPHVVDKVERVAVFPEVEVNKDIVLCPGFLSETDGFLVIAGSVRPVLARDFIGRAQNSTVVRVLCDHFDPVRINEPDDLRLS